MHTRLPVLLLALVGCASPRSRTPDIPRIYEQAALDEVRNPVIVIHGVLGSRLMQRSTGKIVWGAFTSDAIDPETPEGARALSLPLEAPASVFDYDASAADVYAAGPLGTLDLSLFFQVFSVSVYAEILRALGAGGYTDAVIVDPTSPRYADDHYTCFTFFYDWRRDNVENAILLGQFIADKRREIDPNARAKIERLRAEGTEQAITTAARIEKWLEEGYRFDIVAHSMGGLISRYYLRYGMTDLPADGTLPELTWAGSEEIDRLIVVGTPNLGSMDALVNLTQGYQPAFILPFFDPVVLGSMPSIYQLLPRPRHRLMVGADGAPVDLDFMDPAVWEHNGWGLLSEAADPYLAWILPDVATAEERRARARTYLRWCLERARQFSAALDAIPVTPCPSRLSLFAADAEPTVTAARVRDAGGGRTVLEFDDPDLKSEGDGTVARYSAVADERRGYPQRVRLISPVHWSDVTFLSDDHIGLTRNPHFVDNMLFMLIEQPLHRPPPKRTRN